MKKRNNIDFDNFACNYRNIHDQNIKISGVDSNYFSEYKIKEIYKVIPPRSGLKILDLGCGDGNTTKFFHEYYPEATIYGIDISEESIRVAKKRKIKNCTFRVYDGERVCFADNSFDIILMAGVLHHIKPDYRLSILGEIYRVLNAQGNFFLFEHNPYNPLTQRVVKDCQFDKDAILISASNAKKSLKKLLFNSIIIRYTIFMPRTFIFKHLIFLEKYLFWVPLGGQYYIRGIK